MSKVNATSLILNVEYKGLIGLVETYVWLREIIYTKVIYQISNSNIYGEMNVKDFEQGFVRVINE